MSKILFIDDDQATLELMKKATEILDHQPFTCSDPVDVIHHVLHSDPDLILIDINMQDVSGFQVVRQIRSHSLTATTPVLIVSAGDPNVEGIKALESGANGFISKPLSISRLDSAVKQYARQDQLVCCLAF
jgi:DNA-binding response OmpR family regulator